jgi:hypothetical protein
MNPEIRRGQEAERVLAEPLLVEAFAAIEESVVGRLRRVDVGDEDGQRDLVVTLQLLGKVKQYITDVVTTGRMAALEEQRTHWQNLRRKFR